MVSAELRWFWKDPLQPDGIEEWFRRGGCPPGGGTPRVDEYLLDRAQLELGLKRRGGHDGAEVKGLVARRDEAQAPFAGQIQIWSKWISSTLRIDHLPRISVRKTRWLRKFDTSGAGVVEVALDADERPVGASDLELPRGCQLELVEIRVGGPAPSWWSVGFEAFGDLSTVEDSLHRTLTHVTPGAPRFTDGLEGSYPEWLAQLGI